MSNFMNAQITFLRELADQTRLDCIKVSTILDQGSREPFAKNTTKHLWNVMDRSRDAYQLIYTRWLQMTASSILAPIPKS